MTTVVLSKSDASTARAWDKLRVAIPTVLGVWLLIVVCLGAAGKFAATPGTPPIAMGIAVAAPLLLFFTALKVSNSFRLFVMSLDLRLIVAIQAWRWAGLDFLSLYADKVLPAMFALPAGLGDMAIGITAPWMVLALIRQPRFAAGRAFVRWNILGMVDLAVAISLGAAGTFIAGGDPAAITTAPMSSLPLLLIPGFLVPLFFMLHSSALMQSRQLVRSG